MKHLVNFVGGAFRNATLQPKQWGWYPADRHPHVRWNSRTASFIRLDQQPLTIGLLEATDNLHPPSPKHQPQHMEATTDQGRIAPLYTTTSPPLEAQAQLSPSPTTSARRQKPREPAPRRWSERAGRITFSSSRRADRHRQDPLGPPP
jgi:hypothetical protein